LHEYFERYPETAFGTAPTNIFQKHTSSVTISGRIRKVIIQTDGEALFRQNPAKIEGLGNNAGQVNKKHGLPVTRDIHPGTFFCLKNNCNALSYQPVVLGGELAVPYSRNPLYAGLNSRSRVLFRASADHPTGRRATGGHEPRQIRKEAAISDAVCVVDRSRSL